ncbi:MAG: phage tail tape measure protein, partial [bacterium]
MAVQTTVQIRGEDKTAAAFRSVNNRAKNLERSFSGLSASVSGLATSFAGLVGVGALGAFSKDMLQLGDRLQKVSLQLGVTVEELEILQFAASQSGVSTDQLNTALQKFTRNVGEAEQGTAAQKEAFEALGVSISDSQGNLKGTSELFAEVAQSISGIESPAQKAAIATDLFGRAGIELLPLLNAGASGITSYGQSLRDAGGIIGTDAANAFSAFNDTLDKLSRSFKGSFAPILMAIIPGLTVLAENLDHIGKFAGIVATAFIAAKIPALLAAITGGVTALTVAI